MSEFFFDKAAANAFRDDLYRTDEADDIHEINRVLRMFERFCDGDEEYQANFCPPAKPLQQNKHKTEEIDEGETAIKEFIRVRGNGDPDEDWLPMPHFVREEKLRPEAESMVRDVKADIEQLEKGEK